MSELRSEQIVLSAPMSFHGSAVRIWKITDKSSVALKILLVCIALVAVLFAWVVVLCWYLIFGILLIPYRLTRRGQRKRKMENLRHRELMDAVQKPKE